MPMMRSSFRKSLQDGLNAQFGLEYGRYPETYRRILDVNSSKKAYEEDVLLYGLGPAQVKAEGAGVDYSQGGESWVARYHHNTVALAFQITQEAMEDNLYGSLGSKYSKALARSIQHTMEIDSHGVYNNGFSSSYPGGDGVELFSSLHPLKNGQNVQNELTTPAVLSETSLEALLVVMDNTVDDRGIPVNLRVERLVVAPSNQFTARRIVDSPLRSGVDYNDINAVKEAGSVPEWLSSVYLTTPAAWFLKTDTPDGGKFMSRLAVQRGVEGDFESGSLRYKARVRYSVGHTDWRGIFGSAGS